MIGMIRSSFLILLVMILSGCMKTVCRTDTDCHKKLVTQFGDFKDMSPDEIKVKLDQIYDWNDKNNR